ncbi:MAG TPA: methyltransferase [Kofleriaceae bacterium]|nr:methyltransferase [Kofleriaceae bacterium]
MSERDGRGGGPVVASRAPARGAVGAAPAATPSEQLLRVLTAASAEDLAAWRRLVERVGPAALATWLSPPALVAAALADTAFAAALLEALRDGGPAAAAAAAAFPEAAALAAPMPAQVEHDAGSDRPLLDHVAARLLGRKLRGLETRDLALFQDRGLSAAAFERLAAACERVLKAGLGPPLRAAILHLDIAKTASAQHREAWGAQGISLEVHNEAAAAILRRADRTAQWPLSAVLGRLAIAWIEAHGLAGQHVRGEGPLAMYAPFVGTLRDLAPGLARLTSVPPGDAVRLALDALHVLDACDTAAVREGLLDDALLEQLAGVRERLASVCAPPAWAQPDRALAQLAPPSRLRGAPGEPVAEGARAAVVRALADRLRALRAGRQRAGEPAAAVDAAVDALGDTELEALAPALATCQLWYCETATSGLSPAAQLAVLAAAVGAARRIGVDVSRPWHAQLRPLIARLHGGGPGGAGEQSPPDVRYRTRLVEAALGAVPIRALVTGTASTGPLGTLSARLAHPTDPDAIVIDYVDTAESAALVTLLGLYETRSQAAFHAMLKSLCDLYGLRKDEFDRVANEASYLASMNAARSDKARMLDFVRPGRIVEIGPGGGVVLDLLEERFPDSEVIGVDLSREVVTALEQRAKVSQRRWRVVLGAAEELARHVETPVDTVVFCSILHEVYSYTEPRFSLESVREVVAAAFAALPPGGRIVIRDGVMPPSGTRRIRMLAPDLRPTLELYVAQFEGRPIRFTELAPDRVEMTAADAMEFLYTYTWGPASFPYEVRELYGILPYDEYAAKLVEWCGGEAAARIVPNPLRSYLQDGYRAALDGKLELTDEHDVPVPLPDSNCLLVVERR